MPVRCIGPLKSPLSGDLFFRQEKTRVQRLYSRFSLSIKSVFTPKQQSRGSAHSKAFAAQTHENRGRVPRFSYFKREKVSVWELSDVRVLRSQNTDCRKNDSFSTVSKPGNIPGFFCFRTVCAVCSQSAACRKRFSGRRICFSSVAEYDTIGQC